MYKVFVCNRHQVARELFFYNTVTIRAVNFYNLPSIKFQQPVLILLGGIHNIILHPIAINVFLQGYFFQVTPAKIFTETKVAYLPETK